MRDLNSCGKLETFWEVGTKTKQYQAVTRMTESEFLKLGPWQYFPNFPTAELLPWGNMKHDIVLTIKQNPISLWSGAPCLPVFTVYKDTGGPEFHHHFKP